MNHLESSFTGKNAFWRYIIMLLAVLAASNSIGAIPLFISVGISSTADPNILEKLTADPNNLNVLGLNPNIYLLEMLFPFIIGLIAFVLLVKPLNDRPLLKIINGTNTFRWNRFFISAFIWIVASAIYLFAWLKFDPSNFTLNNKTITLIPLILISVFLIPFQAAFEEIIFRGYLMQGFATLVKNRWFPLITTSILFALMHVINPEVEKFGFWTMMPQYVLFGLIFGIMTILDDGIEAAMGAHAANNAFLCIFVTNEASTLQSPAIYEQHNIYPWTEFAAMLFMGVLIIFLMKIIFKWKNFSDLFGGIVPSNASPQVP
jgi:membrane protease YdiL (CAAX protease family)